MSDTNRIAPDDVTITVKSMAAKRRAEQTYRSELIAALGWEPEKTGAEMYAASTRELVQWLTEKELAEGKPLTPRKSFKVPSPLFDAAGTPC